MGSVLAGKRVLIAGHRGLLGSAILRELTRLGQGLPITAERSDLDYRDAVAVRAFFEKTRPQIVIGCAAKVGGIQANTAYPVEFLNDNTLISTALTSAAHRVGVERLVYIGSNCMYPVGAAQPMAETAVFTGPPEPTNLAYAVAKLSGHIQVQSYAAEYGHDWITIIPATLYGPMDNFDSRSSHLAPALLLRFLNAKRERAPEVTLWGSGKPRREFLYVDDAARGIFWALSHYHDRAPLNLGYGSDMSVREAAEIVARVVGYQGRILFDSSRPDGSMQKLLDSSRALAMGYHPSIDFEDGMQLTQDWILKARDFRGRDQLVGSVI